MDGGGRARTDSGTLGLGETSQARIIFNLGVLRNVYLAKIGSQSKGTYFTYIFEINWTQFERFLNPAV
jgi:hypothetical protein